MLNNVPEAVNRMARNVVLNHPNAYSAEIIRKQVDRTSDSSIGGAPTLGGMAVISSDDEEDVSWVPVGNVYALESESFSPATMMDRQDANIGSNDEFRFLIEPDVEGEFQVKKHDVMYLILTDDVKLAFEIVSIETTSNIPPYTQRYVCNRRDDLHLM